MGHELMAIVQLLLQFDELTIFFFLSRAFGLALLFPLLKFFEFSLQLLGPLPVSLLETENNGTLKSVVKYQLFDVLVKTTFLLDEFVQLIAIELLKFNEFSSILSL